MMVRYGKERGLSYGQVSLMLHQGKITYEEIGIVRKPQGEESKSKKKGGKSGNAKA